MSNDNQKESILYAFALEPSHDRETLELYLRQYPDFSEDLIELSYELRLNETLGQSTIAAETDQGWQESWQQFISCKADEAAETKTSNPFERIRGKDFAELADAIGMPRSILTALRDRLPEPSSIPEHIIRRVAGSLAASIDAVRDYLSLPAATIGTVQFKSDQKPSIQPRVTFEKLVRDTEMTDEQRKNLLEGDDGPNRG